MGGGAQRMFWSSRSGCALGIANDDAAPVVAIGLGRTAPPLGPDVVLLTAGALGASALTAVPAAAVSPPAARAAALNIRRRSRCRARFAALPVSSVAAASSPPLEAAPPSWTRSAPSWSSSGSNSAHRASMVLPVAPLGPDLTLLFPARTLAPTCAEWAFRTNCSMRFASCCSNSLQDLGGGKSRAWAHRAGFTRLNPCCRLPVTDLTAAGTVLGSIRSSFGHFTTL
mmetsp:Transcript_80979/g.147769  ORF Transcript_80979/g.147769 Transcript_80979/m.147769 type:complete len:227 (+) Transcript_80979:1407-2087(+)